MGDDGSTRLPPPPGSPDWASPGWNAPELRDVPPPRPSTWPKGRPIEPRRYGLGDLIDATFKIVFWHWDTLIVVAFVLTLPFAVVAAYLLQHWYQAIGELTRLRPGEPIPAPITEAFLHPAIGFVAAPLIQSVVLAPLLSAFVTRAVIQTHLGIEPRWSSLREAISLLPRLLWILLLQFLVFIGGAAGFVLAVGMMIATEPRSATVIALVVLLAIAAAVLAIIVSIRWSLFVQVAVIERHRGIAALRRSWRLTQGNAWKLFGNMLVIGLVVSFATGLVTVVPRLAAEFRGGTWWLALGIVNAATAGLSVPVIGTARTLLYVHCRVRDEGLSLHQLDQGIDSAGAIDTLPLPPR